MATGLLRLLNEFIHKNQKVSSFLHWPYQGPPNLEQQLNLPGAADKFTRKDCSTHMTRFWRHR